MPIKRISPYAALAMLLERGRPEDDDRARKLVASAIDGCRAARMPMHEARAAALA